MGGQLAERESGCDYAMPPCVFHTPPTCPYNKEEAKQQGYFPAIQKWVAIVMADTLQQRGYCTLLSVRGTPWVRHRMRVTSFLHNITSAEFSASCFNATVSKHVVGDKPSDAVLAFVRAWAQRVQTVVTYRPSP